jgi:hypothetical protein
VIVTITHTHTHTHMFFDASSMIIIKNKHLEQQILSLKTTLNPHENDIVTRMECRNISIQANLIKQSQT